MLGEKVAQESVRVIGEVIGKMEVVDVQVLINGVQTRNLKLVRKRKTENEPYKINRVVHLAPSKNKIAVIAKGGNGEQATHEFVVNRVLDASNREVNKPDSKLREKYEKYALIIGIGSYQDANIPDLTYGSVDAKSIYGKLINPNGGIFSSNNIRTLFDDQATLKNIRDAIGGWLVETVKSNDMVFIYYSGHGGVTPNVTGEEPDGRRKYIVPHDADVENMNVTALRNSDLSLLLDRIPANKCVFVMDCCFSGGQVQGAKLKSVSPADTPIGTDVYGQLSVAGRVIVSASQSHQVSLETAQLGHGIFTHHLLEALDGKADLDTDARVSLIETYYVYCAWLETVLLAKCEDRACQGTIAEKSAILTDVEL